MASKKHLNYEELLLLFKYISLEYPMGKITQLLHKNRSTIYRLIINNSRLVKELIHTTSTKYKNCKHLLECKKTGIDKCPIECKSFKKWMCPKLTKFPYICNFCEEKNLCRKEKRLFNPEEAYYSRKDRVKLSKSFPNISKKELLEFDEFFSPLIKEGLSVESIYHSLKEYFPVSSRTARNWIDNGYLSAKRIDLRNAIKREYSSDYNYKRISKDPLLKVGRTWNSYLAYISTHDKKDVLQFDTVHGKKTDKKCVLTIHHPYSKFQIGILLESFTAIEVKNKIAYIRSLLGDTYYFKAFKILLCDNGPEFDKMPELEVDEETGEVYCNVFYTRPYNSGDKGSCERNHELFRYVIKKGKSLDDLTQDDLNFIFSNINSYPRKSLNYRSPIDIIDSYFGKEFSSKLGIKKIPFKDLSFKKKLK